MALNDIGIEVPASTDMFDPDGDMRELGDSLEGRIIVPVANTTDRNALATSVSPSSTEPLFVYRADANVGSRVEWTVDGATWRAISTANQPPVANVAALPATGDFGGQRVYIQDIDVVAWWDEKTTAWQGFHKAYTPGSAGTASPTWTVADYVVQGEDVEVTFVLTLTAAVTSQLQMDLPTGLNMHANEFLAAAVSSLGTVILRDTSAAARHSALVTALDNNTVAFYFDATAATMGSPTTGAANPWTWASGDTIAGKFRYRRA